MGARGGGKDPYTQPSEPILFPKFRIYFADFPYLLCSIDQRLLTLETPSPRSNGLDIAGIDPGRFLSVRGRDPPR